MASVRLSSRNEEYIPMRHSWTTRCFLLLPMLIFFLWLLLHELYVHRQHALFLQEQRWYKNTPCTPRPNNTHDMLVLLNTTLGVLTQLGISSTVCFGTLWGVLRHNALLPWDNNIDLCVLEEDINIRTFHELQNAFNKKNIIAQKADCSSSHVTLIYRNATAVINSFYDCTDEFYTSHTEYGNKYPPYLAQPPPERPNWACASSVRHIRFMHDVYRPLPKWLLQPPFKMESVNGFLKAPVPHDSFEMQKYLYPNDWWLEVNPPFCS